MGKGSYQFKKINGQNECLIILKPGFKSKDNKVQRFVFVSTLQTDGPEKPLTCHYSLRLKRNYSMEKLEIELRAFLKAKKDKGKRIDALCHEFFWNNKKVKLE